MNDQQALLRNMEILVLPITSLSELIENNAQLFVVY